MEEEKTLPENTKTEEQKKEELQEYENKKARNTIGGIIWRILVTLLVLFVLFETVMGVLDMQRINEDKEPIWYLDTKTVEVKGKKETTYNLGLYVIVKVKEGNQTKIVLKPFFLK